MLHYSVESSSLRLENYETKIMYDEFKLKVLLSSNYVNIF
jgi:hypothetical protein